MKKVEEWLQIITNDIRSTTKDLRALTALYCILFLVFIAAILAVS